MKRLRRNKYHRNMLSVDMPSKRSMTQWKRILWIASAGLVVSLALGYGAHVALKSLVSQAFYQNADFLLLNIDVQVNGTIPQSQILKWAGVEKGQNLIAIDLKKVSENLLKVPYIARVNVERCLPDTLKISVDERQPIALLEPKSRQGYALAQSVYYIDVNGMVMKPKAGERLKHLPSITGVDPDSVIEGSKIQDVEVLSALNFIRLSEISPARMDLDLTQIDVEIKGYLRVRTNHQGVIRFRLDCLDQQLQRLKVIFDYAKNNGTLVRTVDLSPSRNVPVTFF
ncbi:MAG: cell division protein FtsQ/DivIB [Verrucomicrobiota bacterium]